MQTRSSRFTRITAIIALMVTGALILAACQDEPELIGTDMEEQQAPPFQLTDHRGQTVELTDLQGKAVAMTFIFTNCPDVCPLIVHRMRMAYEELPEDKRENVAFVTITVDPERDTPETLAEYFDQRGVGDAANWYGLTGDVETMEAIWDAYFVTPGQRYPADPDVAAAIESGDHDHEEFMEQEHEPVADDHDHTVEEDENTAYWLAHTDVIYVLDPENRVRVLMRSDNTPEDLAHNLRLLAP